MAVEIVMPHLSDSMEEGTIVQWLVAKGDAVTEGQEIVEVETDKATVTYESELNGIVLALNAAVGDTVAVGAVIAVVGDGDGRRRVKASPLARRIAAELGVDLATLAGSGPHGRVIRSDVERSGSAAEAAVVPTAIAPEAPATPATPAPRRPRRLPRAPPRARVRPGSRRRWRAGWPNPVPPCPTSSCAARWT